MKKLFLSLIVLCFSANTWAQVFQSGDLLYRVTSSVEPYSVEVVPRNYQNLTSVNIPDSVVYGDMVYFVTAIGVDCFTECRNLNSVTIGNNVKTIEQRAFANCTNLETLTMGNSVETIGESAFYQTNLTSITIPNSVKTIGSAAFVDCQSLTSVVIGDGVKIIGEYAFNRCYNLISIVIGNGIEIIGGYAFIECSNLTSVTIGSNIIEIAEGVFESTAIYNDPTNWENGALYIDSCLIALDQYFLGELIIREGTQLIANQACYDCPYLTAVTIPNSVRSLGKRAFLDCSALTSVTIGNNIKSLRDWTFTNCSSLTSFKIPNSVTCIGEGVFSSCSSLTSITIPDSVTSIGYSAFSGCASLSSITIPNQVTSIESELFAYCKSLKSVIIGNGVTSIGHAAFWGCQLDSIVIGTSVNSISFDAFYESSITTLVWNAKNYQDEEGLSSFQYNPSITTIILGDSVETIPDSFFAYCPNLKTVNISGKSIGNFAFEDCSSLTSVTIGNSVTSIGGGAFFNCTSLESLHIGESVEIIGGQAFQGCHRLKSITLPESLKIIGGSAFHVCTSLTSVVIPDSVTTIEGSAFESCSALESLTIGKSVNYIGLLVVNGCSSLKLIDCKATTPPNFDSMIKMEVNFMSCPSDLVVYVPCGATNAYKNHQHWSYFGNKIQEASYTIDVYSQDSNKGHVVVDQNSICDGAQITAIPHEGYSFIQWTDGNTDNPRRFEITRDTTFTAVFDQIFKGQCGDSLYWHYALNTLTITGTGAMWDNRPWGSVVNEIEHVSLPTGLTYIGDDAFQDCLGLHNIDIPGTVNSIGDYSFNGCRNLTAINCYPLLPPYAETTSFSNYSAQLNAPCDSLEAYKYDMVFGQFRNFECIGSESTTTDGVNVEPTSNTATVTWPTEEGAETYTIEIMNGDEVFCLLTFNADGMLLNIAFAPSRNGNHHPAQYAEQTTNGLRFTITNLHEGTRYGYDITAKDEEDQTLSTYSGEFTTESLTAVENIILPDNNTHKILHNGQLLIIRDGKTYNAMGQEM